MSVMQPTVIKERTTVIKNGKDISNTEEGKAILERLKNFFNIKLPNVFANMRSKVTAIIKKNENKSTEPKKDGEKENEKEKIDEKDDKIKELEQKVEELTKKLEEKKLEDQKKDEPEIDKPKQNVEITEEPKQVPEEKLEAPVLEEHTDDKQPVETVEDKDNQNPSIKQPVIAPVSETVQDVKEKITDVVEKKENSVVQTIKDKGSEIAKKVQDKGANLIDKGSGIVDKVNETAKDSKNVINAVEGASQLLK